MHTRASQCQDDQICEHGQHVTSRFSPKGLRSSSAFWPKILPYHRETRSGSPSDAHEAACGCCAVAASAVAPLRMAVHAVAHTHAHEHALTSVLYVPS